MAFPSDLFQTILRDLLRFLLVYMIFLFGFAAGSNLNQHHVIGWAARSNVFLRRILFFFSIFLIALVTLMGDAPSLSQNKSVAQMENAGSHAMYGGLLSVSLELFKITIGMGDLDFQEHARFRYFVMLLLLLFVILTYVLLLNMLIALMSETVTDISGDSKSVWKLQVRDSAAQQLCHGPSSYLSLIKSEMTAPCPEPQL